MTCHPALPQPLAQVTVVDGAEGDCNVVDFCRLPTKNDGKTVYQDKAWRRAIIDTGPKAKAQNIIATLQLLATTQSFPALATDPAWSMVPEVEELQVRDQTVLIEDGAVMNSSPHTQISTEDIYIEIKK